MSACRCIRQIAGVWDNLWRDISRRAYLCVLYIHMPVSLSGIVWYCWLTPYRLDFLFSSYISNEHRIKSRNR